MIDFRYHLVSIIAIFLALAVGLLVGSTALSGPAEVALSAAQRKALSTNASLHQQNKLLQDQVTADQAFAQAASKGLLDGLLDGQRVVIVQAPGAGGAVTTGVTAALTQAGASVTGVVTLSSTFLDAGGQNEATLTGLAQRLASQASLRLTAQSSDPFSGQQAAAQVLAASLLDNSGTAGASTALSSSTSRAILTGLSQGGYLSVSSGDPSSAPASLAVLVTSASAVPPTAGQVLVATALELKKAGSGTVMAGPVSAVGSSSAISAEDTVGQVSTVDNADSETGQIMTVQALWYLLNGRAPASYGIGPAVAPSPAPSASPTPTITAPTGGHR